MKLPLPALQPVRAQGARVQAALAPMLRFTQQFARQPASIGSIAPSSPALAAAMCNAVRAHDSAAHLVLEIGAGTGAITRALVRAAPQKRMVVVEPNPAFAEVLRKRFCNLCVRCDLVQQLSDIWLEDPRPKLIVSSLPLRAMPAGIAADIGRLFWAELLRHPHSALIQYSYGMRHPFCHAAPPPAVRIQRQSVVLLNLPPAQVWVYQAAAVH